jgi:hypothetical protein
MILGWEVNGRPGGDELYGTVVDDDGVAIYTAPAVPPGRGAVWVTARLAVPGRPDGGLGTPITVEAP